jgi:hypothetical protein
MLYKYCRPERIDILTKGRIALSRPRSFNDPFDLNPHLTSFRNWFDMVADVDQRTANFVVLSLSETPSSLLMWAHYTDAYRGFVLGFSEAGEILEGDSPHRDFGPVFYCHHRPSHERFKMVPNHELFYTKSAEWAYEREWRIVDSLFSADGDAFDVDQNCWPFLVRAEAIREVIVGYRAAATPLLSQFEQVLQDDRYRHIELFHAAPHPQKFELVITPIARDK